MVDSMAVLVRPPSGWPVPDLGECWRHRELLLFLVWRDLKIRYRQTFLGTTWALLQPLLAMAVLWIFLGRLTGLAPQGIPYPLFALGGWIPWMYFSNAVNAASLSLAEQRALITKVYLPRLFLPLTPVLSGLVDLLISEILLLILLPAFGISPVGALLWTPLLAALAALGAMATGLWLSALNALFRDVRHALPLLVQCWLFATPVVYPIALVPSAWRTAYALNPMVGIVEAFRWAALGLAPPGGVLAVSAGSLAALLLGGLWFFRRAEASAVDVV